MSARNEANTPKKVETAGERFVTSIQFEAFMMLIIVMNSVWIASEDYGVPDNQQPPYIVVGTYMFNIIFVAEAILKISIFGFIKYIRDDFNKLDFIVSIFSAGELIFDILSAAFTAAGDGGFVSSVRGKTKR
jgi:hypothetical protein